MREENNFLFNSFSIAFQRNKKGNYVSFMIKIDDLEI